MFEQKRLPKNTQFKSSQFMLKSPSMYRLSVFNTQTSASGFMCLLSPPHVYTPAYATQVRPVLAAFRQEDGLAALQSLAQHQVS